MKLIVIDMQNGLLDEELYKWVWPDTFAKCISFNIAKQEVPHIDIVIYNILSIDGYLYMWGMNCNKFVQSYLFEK